MRVQKDRTGKDSFMRRAICILACSSPLPTVRQTHYVQKNMLPLLFLCASFAAAAPNRDYTETLSRHQLHLVFDYSRTNLIPSLQSMLSQRQNTS